MSAKLIHEDRQGLEDNDEVDLEGAYADEDSDEEDNGQMIKGN